MAIAPNKVEDIAPDSAGPRLRLTYTCMFCEVPVQVDVPKQAYEIWATGAGPLVQDAFPTLSPAEREVLLSGTHGKCFTEAFNEPEDLEELDLESRILKDDE